MAPYNVCVLMEENPKTLLVSVVNFDEAEEKALNLALNKISGDWDDYKLEQVLIYPLQASQKVK
ncbi:hypothetical protein ABE323_18385 [Bacillus licheniformis]|nr:hypothetical protein [Bacillus licheniformis]MDZ5537246.1 hypothetical protein [Bacillus licheniformis]